MMVVAKSLSGICGTYKRFSVRMTEFCVRVWLRQSDAVGRNPSRSKTSESQSARRRIQNPHPFGFPLRFARGFGDAWARAAFRRKREREMRAEGQSEGGNGERDTELLGHRIYLRICRRSNSQRRLLFDSESGRCWSRDFFYRARNFTPGSIHRDSLERNCIVATSGGDIRTG